MRSRAGIEQIDAVAEIRRHQNADNGIADRVFMRQTVLVAKLAVVGQNIVPLRLRKRPAVGARREFQKGIEMAGSASARIRSIRRMVVVDPLEVIADRLQRHGIVLGDRPGPWRDRHPGVRR